MVSAVPDDSRKYFDTRCNVYLNVHLPLADWKQYMQESEAKMFTISEVKKHIQEANENIKSWEKNLKEWNEVLELLETPQPSKGDKMK